ncbi:structure-specific endonuclease subunit slx4 [Plakobranchus ocellatus]|uniref:Structure-specific endonuclease subunit slx4 n=1 Tax=Plakobranchus ocellatus TaxID=259542 RepID=A0AAV3Y9S8_9GAST|nr:structure-specific endonuclease subunit slx4 [Plakobranchus ocellatus]
MEELKETSSSATDSSVNKTPTKAFVNKVFSPVAKEKTRRLLRKALGAGKGNAVSDENILNHPIDQNDSSDFKDAPRLKKPRVKLKLKTSSIDQQCKLPRDVDFSKKEIKHQYLEPARLQPSTSVANRENEGILSSAPSEICESDVKEINLASVGDLHNSEAEGKGFDQENKLQSLVLHSNKIGRQPSRDISTCIICGFHVLNTDFDQHRLSCLRDKFTLQGSGDKTDREMQEEKRCHICSKIISSLNSRAQTQHINNCLDKVEKEKQEEKEHTQKLLQAREAVLGCPLCSKNFKSQQGRQGHLKKCAKDNGMTVDRLKLLMKQQEEDYAANLEAGILPEQFVSIRKKNATGAKSKRLVEPKTYQDEINQLALALSNSLVENEARCDADFTQPEMLHKPNAAADEQAQGPSSVQALLPGGGKTAAKSRKGKETAETNVLLTLPKDQAAERISNRVDNYIFSAVQNQSLDKTPPFKTSSRLQGAVKLPSSSVDCTAQMSSTSSASDTHESSLWDKTSFSGLSSNQQALPTSVTGLEKIPEAQARNDCRDFYVEKLMPPVLVSCVQPGSKIKRISSIPGRRKSDAEAAGCFKGTVTADEVGEASLSYFFCTLKNTA